MSPHPTIAQIRFTNTVNCLGAAMSTLETVKKNRDDCTQILEQIHVLLYGIIRLHITSDPSGELPPNMLYELGKFTETLHKIHTFVESLQEKSRIKQFFRQNEMSTLLKGCHLGLEQALQVFKVPGLHISSDVTEMQQYSENAHQEVLELISGLSDGKPSDRGSSISTALSSFETSSNSLSLLPSEPKIFHGRDTEVSAIIDMFREESPRIAILGAGGMGKTSLARAVVHHAEIAARYEQHRVFVASDSATGSVHLAAQIGAHIGLKPGKDLTEPVIRHFRESPPSLLILDNLETIWEPRESRDKITMRGAERPANVRWTRPFLEPLKPLTQEAARKTFVDIVDGDHALEEIDKILLLVNNMPLAIDLIAHLVDYEGFSSVLHRWETERTSLLSEGHDKGSNLDLSISLSLASSRIRSMPQSQDLLSLLSTLPDGISDTELVQSKLPIDNILACKATLLRTSLVYTDDQRRLKALVPIREYVHKMHPPGTHLVQSLVKYFSKLLELYETYHGTISSPGIVARITTNLGNIQTLLATSLKKESPELVDAIYCTCHFAHFRRLVGHGSIPLIHQIPNVLPQPCDYKLEVYFITLRFAGALYEPIDDAEQLLARALGYFPHFDDEDLKCSFYHLISSFCRIHYQDFARAIHFAEAGLLLSISSGNTNRQSELYTALAWIKWHIGDYSAAQVHAYESQRLARISANFYGEAMALRIGALCSNSLGSYSTSIASFQRATDLLALCGLSGGELDLAIRSNQAEIHRVKSEYVEALNIQTQILHKIEQDPYQGAFALLNIAQIDVEMNTSKHLVQGNIDKALSTFNAIGDSRAIVYSDATRAALNLREGNYLEAKILFQNCLAFAWGRDQDAVSYCLERLSNIQQWEGLDQTSYSCTITFLVHSLKLNQKLEIHKAIQFLGAVYLADGDLVTAVSLLTVALEGFTQMDVHRSRGECMLQLGDIAKQYRDTVKAAHLWNTARPLFERSSQAKQITHIDERLAGVRNLSQDVLSPSYHHLLNLVAPKVQPIEVTETSQPKMEEMENVFLDHNTDPSFVPV
ncbi:hypothetical protein FB451DRAFT_1446776 [Mycena latifolia]|nr:hypothetical protein FB451DRAFT_1446776 [Mycena latifolia]